MREQIARVKQSIRDFFIMPEQPVSATIRLTSTLIECLDCEARTVMTVNGTCAACGGRSFANAARVAVALERR